VRDVLGFVLCQALVLKRLLLPDPAKVGAGGARHAATVAELLSEFDDLNRCYQPGLRGISTR
jgi:hypothetical protein